MKQIELSINLSKASVSAKDKEILEKVMELRNSSGEFISQGKYLEALERTVEALKILREFPDFQNQEFRLLFVALLFDLAEIRFSLKNYKQSEKDIEVLFKVLDNLVKSDEELFGQYHILAMELSTRLLRSRKKALDLLVKQKITTESLYEKVNAGVASATDKLVDSLSATAQLLAATGNSQGALKFYAEAIKFSKKRSGRVTIKEIKMTIDMAEVMVRKKSMRPRAKRLLEAVLPHAVSLKATQEERDILSLLVVIDNNLELDNKWRIFLHKVIGATKRKS